MLEMVLLETSLFEASSHTEIFHFSVRPWSTALMRAEVLIFFLTLNSLWSAVFFWSKLSSEYQIYLYSYLCLRHKPVWICFYLFKAFVFYVKIGVSGVRISVSRMNKIVLSLWPDIRVVVASSYILIFN